MQNRFKSKYLWLSVASLILFILKNWGILDNTGMTVEGFNELVDLILVVLVGVGVINNPTDKEQW